MSLCFGRCIMGEISDGVLCASLFRESVDCMGLILSSVGRCVSSFGGAGWDLLHTLLGVWARRLVGGMFVSAGIIVLQYDEMHLDFVLVFSEASRKLAFYFFGLFFGFEVDLTA